VAARSRRHGERKKRVMEEVVTESEKESEQSAAGGSSGQQRSPAGKKPSDAAPAPNKGKAPAILQSQPSSVEYVVTCNSATGAVERIERLDAGKRVELTPAEYGALAQLYGTAAPDAQDDAAVTASMGAAVSADPFGMYGTPTPAALSGPPAAEQLTPEAQAYYLGYAYVMQGLYWTPGAGGS
jgi:hypothetical protein